MSGYSWTTDNGGQSGYDLDDRLSYWKHTDNSKTQAWTLSNVGAVGCWTNNTIGGTVQTRAHNNVHELTSVDSSPISHDVKGNITQNNNGHAYTWDFNNQLQSVDTNGDNQPDQTFAYTALKQRVKVGGSILAYNGQQVVTQHNGGSPAANSTASWVYASYIDKPIFMLDSASGTPIEYYYHR